MNKNHLILKKMAFLLLATLMGVCFLSACGTKEKEETSKEISVKEAKVNQEESSGADGARLYYVDGNRIVFGGYFGLFVYDIEQEKIIRSVDLSEIGCDYTQGDQSCEISVSEDGKTVYLQRADLKTTYVYQISGNKMTEESLDLSKEKLYQGQGKDLTSATYQVDGKEYKASLTNPWETIVKIGYKDSNGVKIDSFFGKDKK